MHTIYKLNHINQLMPYKTIDYIKIGHGAPLIFVLRCPAEEININYV